jgi:ADP-ribose pyrophosphatase
MAAEANEPTLWEGKYLRVTRRDKWEYVTRQGTSGVVGIVAVTDGGKLVLVEQYRPPVGRNVIEIPAGLAGDVAGSEHEPLADAAARELLEETGYAAREMTYLCEGVSSAGLTDELITLFRAVGLTKQGDGAGDGSEQITLHEIPLADVEPWLAEQVAAGKTVDLKVYAALRWAAGRRG